MIINDIISLDRTQCSVECNSKKRIFEIISQIAVKQSPELDQLEVLSSLISREKMGSTGIGNGIALPHGRIKGLANMIAVIVTSNHPIEFDAIDGHPVDIFFAILVPDEQTDQHLQALSGIARKLSNKDIVKAIRKAETKNQIVAALA
ncbi:PTS IIA-like nitrogen regulatory protein PtsN [Glaciecola petra]|uniref:PTS IIA-like nitrogen regulatory protein PtsN n=1 Tax=Glaciecola petra TaxID=3075602 RepID=A0ABU2ZTP1_9ALTE|nr:PTS IIA-like nitrogen regulatory protein PtsN [Aestuariibacter sp. P117]MDT0595997.1 PTS IIA-like nitrogen regulatory protein PtsN [Aestuariibacter sp. P117]